MSIAIDPMEFEEKIFVVDLAGGYPSLFVPERFLIYYILLSYNLAIDTCIVIKGDDSF